MQEALAGLLDLDRALFTWINRGPHPAWLDQVMLTLSDVRFGRFLFAAIAILLIARSGWRRGLVILLGAACTLAASDQLSAQILKPMFQRPRPANAGMEVHLLVNRTRSYAFPSAHAANSCAGALFFSRFAPGLTVPLFAMAAAVSLSRVYVGVHYPLDLVGGGLVGLACAAVVLRVLAWRGLAPAPRRGRAPPRPGPADPEGLDGGAGRD
jgi:undecaprenyl-diphosphatase